MEYKNRKILVTGAGGFIGSHLTEKLVNLGCMVRAFVRYNSRNDRGLLEILPDSIKGKMNVFMGDLRDSESVREAMKDIEIVFHLAALIAIPYSYIHPREVIDTNVIGTLNVLNAARDYGVEKVIHTSTSEVYGTAQYVPIDEKHPLQAQSPYSASKIAADKIAESFYKSYELRIAIIRPFNTYGPRQSARAVIPTIITQALTGDKVFLGSLHPIRDFTYIEDVIDGFIKMVETDEAIGEVINLGSGSGLSIGELAKRIIPLIGKNVEIVFDSRRVRPPKSEVEKLIANNSKAMKLLHWEPKVSLNEGIKKTIEWIDENIGMYKVSVYEI